MNIELSNHWVKTDAHGFKLVSKRIVTDKDSKNFGSIVEGASRFYPKLEGVAKAIISDGMANHCQEAKSIGYLVDAMNDYTKQIRQSLEKIAEQ